MSGWLTNGMSLATLPLTGNERFPVDTQLTAGSLPEMEAVSLSQAASIMGGNLPLQPSRFYGVPAGATPGTLLTVTGTLYAYQYYIPGPSTIKTINTSTTTGQTGGASFVGIYADNGSGYPGALVTSSNNTSALIATSGAAIQTYTPTTPLLLQAGWYWLASIYTATSTFPTVSSVSATYTPTATQLGFDTALHAIATSGQATTGVSVAATYGTLSGINSGVFPASATLTVNAGTPLIILGT